MIEAFEKPYPILPQYEPRINLIQKDWDMFEKYYFRARNVLIVNVEEIVDNREAKTVLRTDLNAAGQLVFEISARTPEDFYAQLNQNVESIVTKIEDTDILRLRKEKAKKRNTRDEKILLEDHDIHLKIPRHFTLVENKDDFVWIMGPDYDGKKAATQEGIFIYHTPYMSDSMFNYDALLARRDSVLKEHVPGPQVGSYMTTNYFLGYEPVYRELNFDNRYVTEIKGLWKLIGAIKGEPFVSVSMVDESTGRLVTAEAYVHAPGEKKKPLIRDLEAVIKTMSFPVQSEQ